MCGQGDLSVRTRQLTSQARERLVSLYKGGLFLYSASRNLLLSRCLCH